MFNSSSIFPRSPWCLEITTSLVQASGLIPKISNSIGNKSGLALTSSIYLFTPDTNEETISKPSS